MNDRLKFKGAKVDSGREERLAAELRANLRRRKAAKRTDDNAAPADNANDPGTAKSE